MTDKTQRFIAFRDKLTKCDRLRRLDDGEDGANRRTEERFDRACSVVV